MTEVETSGAWLSREELDNARERLPILYVSAVPVRVDDRGSVTHIGLLMRADANGGIGQEVVGGRVLYHEKIRDALVRHLENDLGPMALPRIPLSPQPFTVAEFFPTPGVTPFTTPASTPCRWPSSCRSPATADPSRMLSTCRGSPRRRPHRWPCAMR